MSGELATFDQIVGQPDAVEALTSAYRAQRLPHGMIFAGPTGVGKMTTARALAALFLCEKPKTLAACGKCDSCRSFDSGAHPDFHVIYRQLVRLSKEDSKAKELSADVIREFLIAKANHKSVVGIGKVFVLEEADLMSMTAQNTLLKTLEEPADKTLIILLTDQPDALLPTIKSRCRLVRFAPLDEKTLREQLNKRGFTKDAVASSARFAEGSIGLALRWKEDGVLDRAGELSGKIQKILDGNKTADLPEWFKAAADEYAAKQVERDAKTSKDQATREGLALYFKLSANEFRHQLRAEENDSETMERLCAAIDVVVRSETYLESNVNIPLVLQQFASALEEALRPVAVS